MNEFIRRKPISSSNNSVCIAQLVGYKKATEIRACVYLNLSVYCGHIIYNLMRIVIVF